MKTIKNCLIVVLALLLFSALSKAAETVIVDGLYYYIYEGQATVVNPPNNNLYDLAVYHYTDLEGELAIPDMITTDNGSYPVVSIGGHAFNKCDKLTSVTLPGTISYIGVSAFTDCSALKSINLPNGISVINEAAFSNCSSLTSITLPSNLTTIEMWAFYGSGLESVIIPSSVNQVGTLAFGGCKNLTSIQVMPENATYDSRNNCNAIIETATNTLVSGCASTVIPDGVVTIGIDAFKGTGIASVDIPQSVTSIKHQAFEACESLTSVQIPNSVTSIEWNAFNNCSSLCRIELPEMLTTLESSFSGCTALRMVKAPTSVTTFSDNAFSGCESLDSVVFYGNGNVDDGYKVLAAAKTLIIEGGVESLGNIGFNPTSIYCRSTVPPECSEGTFTGYGATLFVPQNSQAEYFTAPIWERFLNLQPDVQPTVILDKYSLEIDVNEMATLNATVTPTCNIVATSSAPKIAAVRVNGNTIQVMGVGSGTTNITVASEDGKAIPATCKVVVNGVTPPINGDLNNDSHVNVTDINILVSEIINHGNNLSFDLNNDGQLNVTDVNLLVSIVLLQDY